MAFPLDRTLLLSYGSIQKSAPGLSKRRRENKRQIKRFPPYRVVSDYWIEWVPNSRFCLYGKERRPSLLSKGSSRHSRLEKNGALFHYACSLMRSSIHTLLFFCLFAQYEKSCISMYLCIGSYLGCILGRFKCVCFCMHAWRLWFTLITSCFKQLIEGSKSASFTAKMYCTFVVFFYALSYSVCSFCFATSCSMNLLLIAWMHAYVLSDDSSNDAKLSCALVWRNGDLTMQ
jgi:hypothetical protein